MNIEAFRAYLENERPAHKRHNQEVLLPRYYVKVMLAESEEPSWYHVNEQEKFNIHVPDGPYESVVKSMAEQGIRDLSWMYFVDFAPGAYMDEDGFYHVCKDKLFQGERENGERVMTLISPITKVYLPYKDSK